MKNNSGDVIVKKNNQNTISLEQSRKNNIITEIELKNNILNSTFTKPIINISEKIRIILITLYFIFIIGLEFFYRDYLFAKSLMQCFLCF